jgi:hypothetical protein
LEDQNFIPRDIGHRIIEELYEVSVVKERWITSLLFVVYKEHKIALLKIH